jgi:hypothetical protein
MRVRSGQLGLPRDCTSPGGDESIANIARVWRDGGGGSIDNGEAVSPQLSSMATAVQPAPQRTQPGAYHTAIQHATAVVGSMRTADAALPSAAVWRRVRAVISGALPQPTATEMEATKRAALATEADHAGEGDADAERRSVVQAAAVTVAEAAEAASTALCASAAEWRTANRPVWRDVAPWDDELESEVEHDEHEEPSEPEVDNQGRSFLSAAEGMPIVADVVAAAATSGADSERRGRRAGGTSNTRPNECADERAQRRAPLCTATTRAATPD